VNVEEAVALLRELGYPVNPLIEAFLAEFGGLWVEHGKSNTPWSRGNFYFEIDYPDWLRDDACGDLSDFDEAAGERLALIGMALDGQMCLRIGESGKLYASLDCLLRRIGSSAADSLNALCEGRDWERLIEYVPGEGLVTYAAAKPG
jgi:hypothetical protein